MRRRSDSIGSIRLGATAVARVPRRKLPQSASLGAGEIRALCDFCEDAACTLKKLRAEARARNEIPPPYPRGLEEVRRLLAQLWKAANAVT